MYRKIGKWSSTPWTGPCTSIPCPPSTLLFLLLHKLCLADLGCHFDVITCPRPIFNNFPRPTDWFPIPKLGIQQLLKWGSVFISSLSTWIQGWWAAQTEQTPVPWAPLSSTSPCTDCPVQTHMPGAPLCTSQHTGSYSYFPAELRLCLHKKWPFIIYKIYGVLYPFIASIPGENFVLY